MQKEIHVLADQRGEVTVVEQLAGVVDLQDRHVPPRSCKRPDIFDRVDEIALAVDTRDRGAVRGWPFPVGTGLMVEIVLDRFHGGCEMPRQAVTIAG